MACSTCDGYEFLDELVEHPDGGLVKRPCPDCRALRTEPNRFCRQHGRGSALLVDGRCPRCAANAERAENILLERAREAAARLHAVELEADEVAA